MSRNNQTDNSTPQDETLAEVQEEVTEVTLDATEQPDVEAVEETQQDTELEKALAQVEEYKAALQRERADFVNYKKRVEREKSELSGNVTAKTLLNVLPIIDDFDRAIQATPEDVKNNGWMTGFSLIHKKFQDMLQNLGVEQINPLGQPFDPNFHDAIGSDDSDEYESGAVIEVLQKGYTMEGKCIRPAIVRVAN
ncbi:MAG: nucleotide exchange factor GrpE [Chloroflexota bacterium]|nr:nucleotide exchange factor GrpE [Chloroflexota bacterium]NOG65385.1 nucleotide exchange factor GrpE [Chloroflexota bacterium]GIK66772.1 MAG: nucleotide exchange factor GrpE [Chloroflexota bacterium]